MNSKPLTTIFQGKILKTLLRCLASMLVAIGLVVPAIAMELTVDSRIGKIFSDANVNGTFVLYDLQAGRMTASDVRRVKERYIPASTFKILNTLIALDTGAVKDENEVFLWDGKPQPYKSWERSMTLREAIRESSVPVYQQVAQRIGLEKMREHVARAGYGNNQVGDIVDRFWLDGPLLTSAAEQALFAAKLAERRLPFSERAQQIVRGMLVASETDAYTIYAKTGYSTASSIGWYTGWVERGDKLYAFSLNIDLKSTADLPKRQAIALQALRLSGALGTDH